LSMAMRAEALGWASGAAGMKLTAGTPRMAVSNSCPLKRGSQVSQGVAKA
jgi:hypothetical protein